jgi:hypothetical protein
VLEPPRISEDGISAGFALAGMVALAGLSYALCASASGVNVRLGFICTAATPNRAHDRAARIRTYERRKEILRVMLTAMLPGSHRTR